MEIQHPYIGALLEQQLQQLIVSVSGHPVEPDAELPSGKNLLENFFADKILVYRTICLGLTYNFFKIVCRYAPLTDEEWLVILDVSGKTLSRLRSSGKKFRHYQSEKIISLMEITFMGHIVFRDNTVFRDWLNTPNPRFGDISPVELLIDKYGQQLILTGLANMTQIPAPPK